MQHKIGLIGFGTIGSGVYELIKKNGALIKQRTGIDLAIKTICDLRTDEIKKNTTGVNITTNWKDITGDPDIGTVIELIGGIEPAKSIMLAAMSAGKNAVTANKKLLAEDGSAIFAEAAKGNAGFGFEASVCGGIPCIQALRDGLVGNNITSIMGILNGTTNYILTKMQDMRLPFGEVLKDAQAKGFAEADPTFDIEGYDAGHKITILSQLAFNKNVDYKKISIEGITKINEIDIANARKMGYVIKLLGISKLVGNEVDTRVHPTMIPQTHPLASVRNEFNGVMFVGDMTGAVSFFGKGAGSLPTASAVISDVVQLLQKGRSAKQVDLANAVYLSPEKRVSRYYLRMNSEDKPGILAKVAGVLAEHSISIASVHQEERSDKYVPIVIMTHEADEKGMLGSIEKINSMGFIDGKITMIRVEDVL